MNNRQLAETIVEKVGGKENISYATHCATRLRLVLKDESKADKKEIEAIDGVMGMMVSSGQHQIIVGTTADKICEEVQNIIGPVEEVSVKTDNEGFNWKNVPKNILDYVVSCFVPAIPVFSGAGMIKVLVVLLNTLGVLEMGSPTYTFLNTIGDGIFYFLPIIVAINACNKLKLNPMLGVALAAVVLHPNFAGLGAVEGAKIFGLPLNVIDYSAQAIPMILGVWVLKYVDRFVTKISPKIISIFMISMLDLLIVAPLMVLVVGPISVAATNFIFGLCMKMMDWGWLAVGINAFLFPLMVLTGTHNASIPLIIQMFATQGFDPIFLVSGLAANIAESGAAAAVAVKTKNKNLKSTAFSSAVSAMLGITEPALYGVNLRMKRPFIAVLLGALLGGFFCGLIGLQAPAFATPSLITCALFVPQGKSILLGFAAVAVTFAVTFVITYLLGFEDLEEE